MTEQDSRENPEVLLAENPEESASDIVGRTGEEMPLATHDQGHGYVHPTRTSRALAQPVPEKVE